MKSTAIIALLSTVRERVHRQLRLELSAHGMKALSPSHGAILSELFVHQRLTMSDLSARIDRDRSTVTTLVAKLVEHGFVVRQRAATDGRVTHISLTDKGKGLEASFHEISHRMLERTFKGFSAEEKDLLMQLLNRVADNWDEDSSS